MRVLSCVCDGLIYSRSNGCAIHSIMQDSLAIADEVIQGQRQVDDKDGTLTFYTYDIVSPVSGFAPLVCVLAVLHR